MRSNHCYLSSDNLRILSLHWQSVLLSDEKFISLMLFVRDIKSVIGFARTLQSV